MGHYNESANPAPLEDWCEKSHYTWHSSWQMSPVYKRDGKTICLGCGREVSVQRGFPSPMYSHLSRHKTPEGLERARQARKAKSRNT